jgi:hypothetical protein
VLEGLEQKGVLSRLLRGLLSIATHKTSTTQDINTKHPHERKEGKKSAKHSSFSRGVTAGMSVI